MFSTLALLQTEAGPTAEIAVLQRSERSQELKRATQRCADRPGDGIPGKEDENGPDDSLVVKRDQ
jgi:hypothetical protein